MGLNPITASADALRLHMGEMTAQEMRTLKAFQSWVQRHLAKTQEGSPADVKMLRDALAEATRQIEYLHEKFGRTGSGESVLAMLRTVHEATAGQPAITKGA